MWISGNFSSAMIFANPRMIPSMKISLFLSLYLSFSQIDHPNPSCSPPHYFSPLPTLLPLSTTLYPLYPPKGTGLPWASAKRGLSSNRRPNTFSCIQSGQGNPPRGRGFQELAKAPGTAPAAMPRRSINKPSYTTVTYAEGLGWSHVGSLVVGSDSVGSYKLG